jgi:hypothetical protein
MTTPNTIITRANSITAGIGQIEQGQARNIIIQDFDPWAGDSIRFQNSNRTVAMPETYGPNGEMRTPETDPYDTARPRGGHSDLYPSKVWQPADTNFLSLKEKRNVYGGIDTTVEVLRSSDRKVVQTLVFEDRDAATLRPALEKTALISSVREKYPLQVRTADVDLSGGLDRDVNPVPSIYNTQSWVVPTVTWDTGNSFSGSDVVVPTTSSQNSTDSHWAPLTISFS